MPSRLRRLLATLFVAALALVLPLSAQAAGPTYAVKAFTVTVGSGGSVSTAASLASNPASIAAQYGVCVRDASSRVVDFAPKLTNVTLTTSGTAYNAAKSFPAGTYRANVCYQPAGGAFTTAGAAKTFTVAATSSPSPSPTPTAAPTPTASPSPTPSQTSPAVLFSDDFTGSGAYDHGKWGEWSACTYNGSAAYGKIGCGDRAHLDGAGNLVVPATPDQGTSISTIDHFRFTTGTMTVRAKMPTQGGYWPAFWGLATYADSHETVGGEVDVFEGYTSYNGYRRAVHNYPHDGSGSWSSSDDPVCGTDNGGQTRGVFRNYSAKIADNTVTFYVDGVQCGPVFDARTEPSRNGRPYGLAPANPVGLYLLLTNAVDGHRGDVPDASQPSDLVVDSVTVTAS